MLDLDPTTVYAVFAGERMLAHGNLATAVRAAHDAVADGAAPIVLADSTGQTVDLDLRGSADEAAARLAPPAAPQRRGRPKLGVTAREVTLLPRHWDWLAAQPGGASAALRRLVDEARRATADLDAQRRARDAAYRAMTTLAGDLSGYEEAVRALFAGDITRASDLVRSWPSDIAGYLDGLVRKAWTVAAGPPGQDLPAHPRVE